MYYLGTRTDPDGKPRDYMGLAESTDLLDWKDATDQPVLPRRPGTFDSRVMEPGPAPFVTDAGILLLYNGADDHLVYGPAAYSSTKPIQTRARLDKCPTIIFLEGAVARSLSNHTLSLTGYYGAADKYIGALRIKIVLPQ